MFGRQMIERDIWRSAKALIDKHSDGATIHAAMRADELLAQGDMDGAGTWRRVLAAVKELERTDPDIAWCKEGALVDQFNAFRTLVRSWIKNCLYLL